MVNRILWISVGSIIVAVLILISFVINILGYFKEKKEIKVLEKKIKAKDLSFNQTLTHKYNLEQRYLQTIQVLVTILLVLITTYFSYWANQLQITSLNTQIDLANANQEYLQKISSSNWANLEITFWEPFEKRLPISAIELATPQREFFERVGIKFTAINSGKVNSGEVSNLGNYNPNETIFTVLNNSNSQGIRIAPQSGVTGVIYLSQEYCGKGSEEECDESKIPHKEYDINLKFSCEFCEPNKRILSLTIPVCIYHNLEEGNYCRKL